MTPDDETRQDTQRRPRVPLSLRLSTLCGQNSGIAFGHSVAHVFILDVESIRALTRRGVAPRQTPIETIVAFDRGDQDAFWWSE